MFRTRKEEDAQTRGRLCSPFKALLCSPGVSDRRQLKLALCSLVLFVASYSCPWSLVMEHTTKLPTFPTLLFQTQQFTQTPRLGAHPGKASTFRKLVTSTKAALVASLMNEECPKEKGDKREFGTEHPPRPAHWTPVPPSAVKSIYQGCPRAGPGSQPVLKPHPKILLCALHLLLAEPSLLEGFPYVGMLLPAFLQGTPSQVGMATDQDSSIWVLWCDTLCLCLAQALGEEGWAMRFWWKLVC